MPLEEIPTAKVGEVFGGVSLNCMNIKMQRGLHHQNKAL